MVYETSRTELFAAIWSNDLEKVKEVIDNGASLKSIDTEQGLTVASVAVVAGIEMLRTVLALGADPNQSNEDGTTALTQAVLLRDQAKVCLLLEIGGSIDAEAGDETSLHIAADYGSVDIVRLLGMRSSQAGLNRFDYIGRTPLMVALDVNHFDVARELVNLGGDIDAKDETKFGETAIARAVALGTEEHVQFLMDLGANKECPLPFHKSLEDLANTRPPIIRSKILQALEGTDKRDESNY